MRQGSRARIEDADGRCRWPKQTSWALNLTAGKMPSGSRALLGKQINEKKVNEKHKCREFWEHAGRLIHRNTTNRSRNVSIVREFGPPGRTKRPASFQCTWMPVLVSCKPPYVYTYIYGRTIPRISKAVSQLGSVRLISASQPQSDASLSLLSNNLTESTCASSPLQPTP